MDGSSLLALADLLKPPEEERESDDVRITQVVRVHVSQVVIVFMYEHGKGHGYTDLFTELVLTGQMALIIHLICSHTHLLRVA
jgi:hypothetical protein